MHQWASRSVQPLGTLTRDWRVRDSEERTLLPQPLSVGSLQAVCISTEDQSSSQGSSGSRTLPFWVILTFFPFPDPTRTRSSNGPARWPTPSKYPNWKVPYAFLLERDSGSVGRRTTHPRPWVGGGQEGDVELVFLQSW